jgi:hypothetical protein
MTAFAETGLLHISGVPEASLPEIPSTPEFVVAAHAIQADRSIKLGFHEYLGKTEEEYRQLILLPKLEIPQGYLGRFTPVIVDKSIPIDAMHDLLDPKVINLNPGRKYVDLNPVPYPRYLIWVDNGQRYVRFNPHNAVRHFLPDELPLSIYENFALRAHHPEYYNHTDGIPERAFVAMGSRTVSEAGGVNSEVAPDIRHFVVGKPFSGSGFFDYYVSGWVTPSRGMEIVRLGPPEKETPG